MLFLLMRLKIQIQIVVVISLAAIALIAAIPDKEASAKDCPRTDLQLPPTPPILVSLLT